VIFQLVLYKPQRFQYFSSVPVLHFTGGTFYTPTHREVAILQSPCPSISLSIHTFITDISASTAAKSGLIWFSGFRGEDLNVIFYQNMPNLHNR
jgi:hypothetical protein